MAFIDPAAVIPYFELRPDMQVADFGCGIGAYSIPMSRSIMPNGRVYAIEVQKDLLATLKNAITENHLGNVELLWGDIESAGGTKIADRVVDLVLLSNVLFQTSDKGYKTALEAKRVLKSGGRVVIIDWTESFGNMGPHPDQVVTQEMARKTFETAGFQFVKDFPAGDNHYGIILSK